MTNSRTRIAILDYGMGNLHSVANALRYVAPEVDVVITADASVVASADRVIFPGVGAIRDCMAEIRRLGFDQLVKQAITEKPVLGICIGMQALLEYSEENNGVDCLAILPGKVKFFGRKLQDINGAKLKIPHMGWSRVHQTTDHSMWQGIDQDSRFYFVHSYYVGSDCVESDCAGTSDITGSDTGSSHKDEHHHSLVAGTCDYSVKFAAALARDNLFAVQFHPEKSHTVGLQLLRNFVSWRGTE